MTRKKDLRAPQLSIEISQVYDSFQAYGHQETSWARMTRVYNDDKKRAGILVIPTGGGKTIIAARWLLQHHINQGGRVLWLAHRKSLLRQASNSFAFHAHVANKLKTLEMIRISSDDCKWSQVGQKHHVVFSSVQSAAMPNNIDFVSLMADQSPKGLFVVVDEAHHAAAPSYLRLFDLLKKRDKKDVRLLGLTATPWRSDADDAKRLWNAFDATLIYQVSTKELIELGILAAPHVETVKTHVAMEQELNEEDLSYMRRWGELGEKVLARLAKNTSRNKLIVKHYKDNANRYGKTILFACDTLHAQTLATEFVNAGVIADYVSYNRNDNDVVLDAYRDQPTPMVVTNVEILTEGYDAPKTQSVFLCRPTNSQSLLSQMIGRALRGRAAGGTDEAYLVTFVDTWGEGYDPLDIQYVVTAGEVDALLETDSRIPSKLVEISAELIAEAYRLVQSAYKGKFESYHECLPHSWFVWEEETELDINRRQVLVYENQVEGYAALVEEVFNQDQLPDEISEEYVAALRRKYFGDVPDPMPALSAMIALCYAFKNKWEVRHYTFEEKRQFDPNVLAEQLKDVSPAQRVQKLNEMFAANPVCALVYRDFQQFNKDVASAIERLVSPTTVVPPTVVKKVPDQKPAAWPLGQSGYRLTDLWPDMTKQTAHFPDGVPQVSDIRWSKAPLRGVWGFYRHRDRSIVVSSLLNSPDIPRFVLEFLLYHEVLHADMPEAGHNLDFRERERRFTPSTKAIEDATARGIQVGTGRSAWRVLADQFLDTFDDKFDTGRKARRSYY